MPLSAFHPLTQAWFLGRFAGPTEAQARGWPEILAGRNTLIAAPTGSGKTLAAFLACIDRLLRERLDRGSIVGSAAGQGSAEDESKDGVRVLYVSPLKALSNDVRRNLETPLAELEALALAAGQPALGLRALVRTGDTPAAERQAMLRHPPQILVTTPESLYLLLTGAKSRALLRTVDTVIVDEIHALARDKRGSHLALSLERLEAVCARPPVRIGLSATQRPLEEIAGFLVGNRTDEAGRPDCRILDFGHLRELDLGIELPASELAAVCTNEQWAETYERLAELVSAHRSTLLFVNTRRLAERVCHQLAERLGEEAVASHHGSLSRETRLDAEARLKSGQLKAIVATASLELGIDVGYIDLVCQLGSPRSIATFLQRVGRAGHAVGALPKGRLLPLTRDDLLEGCALLRAVRRGRLDRVEIPRAPLDILAQQMIAEVAAEPCDEEALFQRFRRAWPYRELARAEFDEILTLVSEGIAAGRKQGAYLHRDQLSGSLRPRRSARLTAATSGGAIPELGDYRVLTVDERTFVGTVNEDFAIESMAGDVFLLGNTSWRIAYVRGGEVAVSDAHGAPATIPFWLGEAPGRTIELSDELSDLRQELADGFAADPPEAELGRGPGMEAALAWLERECGLRGEPARQAAQYVQAQRAALGLVPTGRRIVFERFFDESGGMQLVIHAPLGARVNRAWGLALRKRFCRSFDFELQAAAVDNGVVLSLGPQHSFPIEQMFKMLGTHNGQHLLTQALLAAPMFQVRWRWNVTRALAVLRQNAGQKVPPPLQRFRADDLLAAVFPAQAGCFENHEGDKEIPDHPLVRQTIHDCLHEAMDLPRWLSMLGQIESQGIELVARDTREPSPFSHEILNANPYAFLDDAPLEERRSRAVATRRTLSLERLRDLGRLDPAAIEQVRREAAPTVRDADELHDLLLQLGALPEEQAGWPGEFAALVRGGRAVRASAGGKAWWVACERWPLFRAAFPGAAPDSPLPVLPDRVRSEYTDLEAISALVRGQLDVCGPTTAESLAERLALPAALVRTTLEALEGEGVVLRGQFTPPSSDATGPPPLEWCERRLLARIHRLTLDGLRRQVQPVEPRDYLRFLLEHQHAAAGKQLAGRWGVREAIGQLQGLELPAGAWEGDLLAARVATYDPDWLDELCFGGEAAWGRLAPPPRDEERPPSGSPLTRAVPISLALREDLGWLLPPDRSVDAGRARSNAQLVHRALEERGALFFADLVAATGLLPGQVEEALGELAALGLITADGFSPIRKLVTPERAAKRSQRRGNARPARAYTRGGRWARFTTDLYPALPAAERLERWARLLLRRWGVVFRDLLVRDSLAPPWRELGPVFRRLEARGELRGGRFVAGVAGEQFALPAALERLRQLRDEPLSGAYLVLSACDPANLFGIVTAEARIPAVRHNRLLVQDGQLVAARLGSAVEWRRDLPAAERAAWEFELSAADRPRGAARQEHAAPRRRAGSRE